MLYQAKPVKVAAWKILVVHPARFSLEEGKYFPIKKAGEPCGIITEDTSHSSGTCWVDVTSEMTARYFPEPGDYLVKQEDGYLYINPKAVFERKYEPLSPST